MAPCRGRPEATWYNTVHTHVPFGRNPTPKVSMTHYGVNRTDKEHPRMPHVRKPKLIEQRIEQYADYLVDDPGENRGCWRRALGKPDAPLHVDLGCGKGLWAARVASAHPDIALVAIDNERMCASFAVEAIGTAGIANARVILDEASSVNDLFAPGEADVLHINFPTPFPRKKEALKRVTDGARLMEYRTVLGNAGEIHLKTDSQPLFDFTLEQLEKTGWKVIALTRDLHHVGKGGRNQPIVENTLGGTACREAVCDGADFNAAAFNEDAFDAADFTLSFYEEKLTAKGARVLALHAVAGPAPDTYTPTEPTGLAAYLPEDLESLDYAPHGMEDTVANMRNRKRNAQAREARHAGACQPEDGRN